MANAFNNIEKRHPGVEVPIQQLIEEARDVLSYLMRAAAVEVVISGANPTVRVDAALVEHLFLNIFTNAIDAFESVGRDDEDDMVKREIRVTINEIQGSNVEVRVTNNGPPISEKSRAEVFKKGVTSKPHGQGHGQGLYICRLVAQHLGGEIVLLPNSMHMDGFNVCFVFKIPLAVLQSEDLMNDAL